MTLQYKDTGGVYRNIQTITNWIAPTANDGTQIKTFSFATVNTTAIRVWFDSGNSDGWSFMEEIQVYRTPDNLALAGNGGNAVASSYLTLYGGCPPSKLNDGMC